MLSGIIFPFILKMNINKVAMPIKDLLKVANAYTDAHPAGVRQSGGGTATENQDPRSSLYERIEKLINKK